MSHEQDKHARRFSAEYNLESPNPTYLILACEHVCEHDQCGKAHDAPSRAKPLPQLSVAAAATPMLTARGQEAALLAEHARAHDAARLARREVPLSLPTSSQSPASRRLHDPGPPIRCCAQHLA
jgi:hypothetical protein